MVALGLLSSGERATVVEVRGTPPETHHEAHSKSHHKRVASLGLREGQTVEMLTNGGRGPLLVMVDNSRIAIARRMAHNIIVKKDGR